MRLVNERWYHSCADGIQEVAELHLVTLADSFEDEGNVSKAEEGSWLEIEETDEIFNFNETLFVVIDLLTVKTFFLHICLSEFAIYLLVPVWLSLEVALDQWFYGALGVWNWKEWIILGLFKVEGVFEDGFTDIGTGILQFLLEQCPFFVIIFTGKPYLIVSEGFIKCNLLTQCLDQSFDGVAGLRPRLYLFLPILHAIIIILIVITELLAFETHISIWSLRDQLVVIIVTFSWSEGYEEGSLSISDALKGHTLIGSCILLE